MYCDKCGYKNSDDAKFCVGCGNNLSETQLNNNMKEVNTTDGKATASLVLGIVSLVIPCCSVITAIVGLTLGVASKSKTGTRRAGIVLNTITLVLFALLVIVWINVPAIHNIISEEWRKESEKIEDSNDEWEIIEPDEKEDKQETPKNSNLDKKENGKTIVYLFRGEGCPHCSEAEEWLESIKSEYGSMFVIKDYEVWYNKDNADFMEQVAEERGETVNGVPYIIIGDKSWKGFTASHENDMLEEIKKVYNE